MLRSPCNIRDEEIHRHATKNLDQADALLFGRVTYEMMESAWRPRDLGKAVQELKRESGKGLLVGGVELPLALAELGLIDEYEFVMQPRLVGHRPTLFAGLSKRVDLRLVGRLEFDSGAPARSNRPSSRTGR